MMQAHASTNISDVHTAVNSIIIRHVQPVSEVQTNSVTTPSYGGFNSATNPIVDPMVTMMTKMASLDLDPGTFLAAFGGAASIGVPTFAPPGMHHYGPPQTYHNGRYSPRPSGYAASVSQGRYHSYSNERVRCDPHNICFTVMILLQDVAGRKKPILPLKIDVSCLMESSLLLNAVTPLLRHTSTLMDWRTLVLCVTRTNSVS